MAVRMDVGLLANDLRVTLSRLVRRLRSEHQVPLAHGAVLGRLEREGPRSTAELAAAERMRPQSMGQMLVELESLGFVERQPDPTDGRRTLLELTDAGRLALASERRRRDDWLALAIREGFTPEERETLARAVRLLERLVDL